MPKLKMPNFILDGKEVKIVGTLGDAEGITHNVVLMEDVNDTWRKGDALTVNHHEISDGASPSRRKNLP